MKNKTSYLVLVLMLGLLQVGVNAGENNISENSSVSDGAIDSKLQKETDASAPSDTACESDEGVVVNINSHQIGKIHNQGGHCSEQVVDMEEVNNF